MNTVLPHLDLSSQNPSEQRLDALKQLFPVAVASDADKGYVLQAVKVYNERHEGELRFQVV
jgi:hypothetical protein